MLTQIDCKDEFVVWPIYYWIDYRDCIACKSSNKKKVSKLEQFKFDFTNLVEDYFNSLNYGNWRPDPNEPHFTVTTYDKSDIRTIHVSGPKTAPTLFDYNYFKTKDDAQGLVNEIKRLIKKLQSHGYK